MLKPLYSRTSTGALQVWKVFVKGNTFWTESGQVGGKMNVSKPTVCAGKSIGRANETLPEEQAKLEAQSKWDKKAKTGYFEDPNKVDDFYFVEPMLATPLHAVKDGIQLPCIVETKFNGCLNADTLIDLADGSQQTIQMLVENKQPVLVKTYNTKTGDIEDKPISGWMVASAKLDKSTFQWYKLKFENGHSLVVTGNHRIWVDNLQCWRRVEDLDGTEDVLPLNLS